MRATAFRVANGVWALLFVYATAVQYNDPDPVRWMLVYGFASVACVRAAVMQRPGWFLPTAVGSIALGWAAVWLPGVLAHPPAAGALTQYRMLNVEVEEARELLGLLLTALWMTVLAVVYRPRSKVVSKAAG